MPSSTNSIKKYYEKSGEYLKDHDAFLQSANIHHDLAFLTKALSLTKKDTILDIACGQGRHVNAFAEKGYHIDGVDFSKYLLSCAKKNSEKQLNTQPSYFYLSVEKINLKKKYTKAYWFFSDLANINLPKAIASIHQIMEPGGKVLFDTDNIFRMISYLQTHPQTNLTFDAAKLELIDKKKNAHVPYPVFEIWHCWFLSHGFSIKKVIGNYDFSKYDIKSRRLIMIVEKAA